MKRGLKKAHYVSRSAETSAPAHNYPAYEVSNYGRVRASARKDPNAFLKPRWYMGKPFVVLTDFEGNRQRTGEYFGHFHAVDYGEAVLWSGMDVKGLTASQMSDLADLYQTKLRLDGIPFEVDGPEIHAEVCQTDPSHSVAVGFFPADAAARIPNRIDVFCYPCQMAGRPDMSLPFLLQSIDNRKKAVTLQC